MLSCIKNDNPAPRFKWNMVKNPFNQVTDKENKIWRSHLWKQCITTPSLESPPQEEVLVHSKMLLVCFEGFERLPHLWGLIQHEPRWPPPHIIPMDASYRLQGLWENLQNQDYLSVMEVLYKIWLLRDANVDVILRQDYKERRTDFLESHLLFEGIRHFFNVDRLENVPESEHIPVFMVMGANNRTGHSAISW